MTHLEEPILDHLRRHWNSLQWKCTVSPPPTRTLDKRNDARYIFESRCGLIVDIGGSHSQSEDRWVWEVKAGWKKEFLSKATGTDWFNIVDKAIVRSMNILEDRIKREMSCYENLVRSQS